MIIALSRLSVIIICANLLMAFPVLCKHLVHSRGGEPVRKELQTYAVNKKMPDHMQEVILAALSFYPELKETPIEFVLKDDIRKSVMQAQPKISSIFKRKSSRKYVIKMSRHLKLTHENINISTLPCEVLVGWIGHELGHIMDYKDRSSFSMIKFGFNYVLFQKFVIEAEKAADLYALKHGLGDHIMETKNFVLDHADIPAEYKAKSKRLYMSPDEYRLLLGEVAP